MFNPFGMFENGQLNGVGVAIMVSTETADKMISYLEFLCETEPAMTMNMALQLACEKYNEDDLLDYDTKRVLLKADQLFNIRR